jgi:CheY-like chemotaxis protein
LNAVPRSVIVLPVLFEDQVKAVIELASLYEFSPTERTFLEQLSRSIGIVLNTIEATMRTEHLLAQSQQLAVELQTQQNELQETNEEIAQKAALLAEQKAEVEHKNQQIEHARRALEDKAAELALTSRYKSEFLANMSHELRTPLNSILILGQQLAENPETNLSPRQVEFAKTIHAAGTDLLHLISDILDLSKIESGTVTVDSEEIPFSHLRENIERGFRHDAERRHLDFSVDFAPDLGRALNTDPKRLQQILKNLLSNALKFTEQGSVRLSARVARAGWTLGHKILDQAPTVVAFEVTDTGIGISQEKQKIVFEAFQQADAGTSRKYGGTGLGLAISREIAGLLGGELRLVSAPGKGSTFTLYLPLNYVGADTALEKPRHLSAELAQAAASEISTQALEEIPDDRTELVPGEPSLLVVEDDPRYATVLRDHARSQGFKVLVANRGSEALRLVREYKPSAISLDIFLPDMLGWTVLARLKQDSTTRHIPVQIVTVEEERHHSIERGAFSYLAKPATTETISAALERIKQYTLPRVKRLLVVEDDAAERMSIEELIRHDDVQITTVGSGEDAMAALASEQFDCVVLDLRLPDMTGFDLLDRIQGVPELHDVPIVVFTGKDLTSAESERLKKAAKSVVIKGVESPERLLDETALFLHRVVAELPPAKRRMVQRLHESDEALRDKRVLVVDDDVRNIFALSSVLERHGMDVVTAGTGQEAIEKVADDADIDLVLMDIMMPGMDGYDTMRAIRSDPESRALPIVALTAKAMKGDREKCLEAGASDYLAKPVVTDQLLGVLRQWLHR